MNDFEKDLQDIAKPDIQVPIYQQNLRRNLMTQAVQPQKESSRLMLSLATFSAGLFAALLILFVARPEVPNQLHQMIVGNKAQIAPARDAAPTNRNAQPPGSVVPVSTDNLLADKRLSQEADRLFLTRWLSSQPPEGISQLKTLAGEGVISFRRYLDEGGNEVVVYTTLNKAEKNIF